MKKALFIGDSITEGFDLSSYFPGKQYSNQGISGYSSGEVLNAMNENWLTMAPDLVFICMGTNDIARDISFSEIIDNTRKLVEKIRVYNKGNCTVYLTSLFPTRHNPPRPNPKIRAFNVQLHQLANQVGCEYLHLNSFFCDENGMLKREFTHDGLHLTVAAYKKWVRHINDLF
jgi:lysophospholipase L1-like esterase